MTESSREIVSVREEGEGHSVRAEGLKTENAQGTNSGKSGTRDLEAESGSEVERRVPEGV